MKNWFGYLKNNFMNTWKTAICLLVLSLFVNTEYAKASHAMAVDITYECLGSNKYYFCVS